MKNLLSICFAEEIKAWHNYNSKAKAASIYFGVSLILFALCVMTGAILPILVSIANLTLALYVGQRYIPNFRDND